MNAALEITTAPPPTSNAAEQAQAARSAASSAVPYAQILAQRSAKVARGLRRGQDQIALETLAGLSEDLEHFLKFLVLIVDYFPEHDASSTAIKDYKSRVLTIVEELQPSLADLDLVEVADAVEDDLVPALEDYQKLDALVQRALTP